MSVSEYHLQETFTNKQIWLIFQEQLELKKECGAVLTGLYKKNGAVSCVGSDFISDLSLDTFSVSIFHAISITHIFVNEIQHMTL